MRPRAGYTLLEVMLAIAIGLLLVAALYVALDVQFRYMQSGRNAVVQGQLARGLLSRIAGDVRLSLALLPINSSNSNQGGGGGAASPAGATGSTDSSNTQSQDQAAATTTPGQYNFGVLGDEFQLVLFISVVPRYGRDDVDIQDGICDIRRVTYWAIPGEGLVRQEVRTMTADGSLAEEVPPDLLAPEVTDLRFRYYDPSLGDWVTSWDGTATGPPLAVEITLALQLPPQSGLVNAAAREPRYYRRVVAVPAASISQDLVNQQAGVTP